MRLSTEIFEQILSTLRSDAKSDKEKRAQPRIGVTGDTTAVTIGSDGKRIVEYIRVRNISSSGIGFFYGRKMKMGTPMIIRIDSETGEWSWLICTVAHCARMKDSGYAIGAKIRQLLKADEVSRLATDVGSAHAAPLPVENDKPDAERISKAILS
jgi:hypothetical protein